MRRLLLRLINALRPARAEPDLVREIASHLALLEDDFRRRGMTIEDARLAAKRAFGGEALAKDLHRDARSFVWLDSVRQDFQYAARTVHRNPGFATTAILTLALGIGANTAIFSLVDSLLLRPLPVKDPERLVLVADPSRGADAPVSGPNLLSFMWNHRMWTEIRQRPQLFDGSFAYFYSRFNLAPAGERDLVDGLYVSGRFFETLGVAPLLGRTFTDADDRRGGGDRGPVAVISQTFWSRRLGAAPDVVGRTLTVERVAFTIVGVLPAGFDGPVAGRKFDIAIPVGTVSVIRGPVFLDGPGVNWLTIMGRLKRGQTREDARTALNGVQPQIRDASKPPIPPGREDTYLKNPLTLLPATRGNPLAPLRVRAERGLWTMQLAVALVLVIACTNLANLTMARSVARRREMSVRLALGASSRRLAQQLAIESLLLASIGAVGALPLANWGTRVLVSLFSSDTSLTLTSAPDVHVLGFTAIVTIAALLLFGVLPAQRAARVEPLAAVTDRALTVIGSRVPLAGAFVTVQVALSLLLLVGGALLIRSYAALATKDLGFDPVGVLVVDVGTAKAGIPPATRLAAFEDVRRAVASTAGVSAAALADLTPIAGGAMAGDIEVVGIPNARGRRETFVNRVGVDWLSVYRMHLLSGRDITDDDRSGTPRIALINQAFGREFLNGENPLGHVVRQLKGPPGRPPMEWQIVGVVGDAVYDSLRVPVPPTIYWAFDQIDDDLVAAAAPTTASLSIRTAGQSPMAFRRSVAAAITRVHPRVDLEFRLLPDVVSGAITLERTLAILSGFFGALSLALAVIGLYGVTSYSVSRRRAEIGIRMALGASPSLVVRQVLQRVMMLVCIGAVVGAALSLWASQFVASLLYAVEPRDPTTLIGAAAILGVAGVAAGWLPARRAARVDPLAVLRCE